MIRPHARRRTARFLAATLAASFFAMGIPAPASAAEPPPAPTDLVVRSGDRDETFVCGTERAWVDATAGFSVQATTTFPDAAPGQTELTTHLRLFRDGQMVYSTSGLTTIGSGGGTVPVDVLVDGGEYTVQVTASDAELGSPEGPAAECLVGVRMRPENRPTVRPVLGTETAYSSSFPRGGVGMPGLFVIYTNPKFGIPPYEDVVEYEYAITASTVMPTTWSAVPRTGDTTFLEVVPTAGGWQYLVVRARDASGLTGLASWYGFNVATEPTETPPPLTLSVPLDDDDTDGMLPVDLVAGVDLTTGSWLSWTKAEIVLSRGDVELVRTTLSVPNQRIEIPEAPLGDGPNPVTVTFQMMPGAPIWADEYELCVTGCTFASDGLRYDEIWDFVAVGNRVRGAGSVYPEAESQSYQWYIDGEAIPGATSLEYKPVPQDEGGWLALAITFERTGYESLTLFTEPKVVGEGFVADIWYSAQVQNLGWLHETHDGGIAGTVGQGLQLEALNLGLYSAFLGNLEAEAHVQGIGWQAGWQSTSHGGGTIGTAGQGLRLEALRLSLTGEVAQYYDVYYRAHAQNFGWLGWAKNGEDSGTSGYGYRLEAVQVQILPKGASAPADSGLAGSYDKATQSRLSVSAHVQNVGWMAPVAGGQTAGTEGRGLRVEALRFGVAGDVPGGIEASAHVQNIGWQPFTGTGGLVGTEGQALRVEAFRIRLTGQLAEKYDVYYRTHAQNFGWLGWAKNGEDSGTAGYAYRLEAVQVLLVPKGGPAPSGTGLAFHQQR